MKLKVTFSLNRTRSILELALNCITFYSSGKCVISIIKRVNVICLRYIHQFAKYHPEFRVNCARVRVCVCVCVGEKWRNHTSNTSGSCCSTVVFNTRWREM